MSNEPEDDDSRPFTHRVVAAAAAPAVKTNGARSVFALGGAEAVAPPPDARESRPRSPARVPRALEVFKACGRLTAAQLAEAMDITKAAATKLVGNMHSRGLVNRFAGEGRSSAYELKEGAPQSGFKAWLQRKAEPSAEGRPVRKSKAAPVALHHLVPAAPPAPPAPDDQGLICGLLNTGELLLEADGQQLRLSRGQARGLVKYLEMVASALHAA